MQPISKAVKAAGASHVLTALKRQQNEAVWIEHGTHESCSEPIWWWLQQHSRSQAPARSQPAHQNQHPCPALPLAGENGTFFVKSIQISFACKGLCLLHVVPLYPPWIESFLGWKGLVWAVSEQGQQKGDAPSAWLCSHEQMSLQLFHCPSRVNQRVFN